MAKLADEGWKRMQQKTFTKWTQLQLKRAGKPIIESLEDGFADGINLCNLLEAMSDDKVGKMAKPKMRFHKVENLSKCFTFMKEKGLKLINIGPEDMLDGNLKLTLGLVWSLIEKWDISEMSDEDLSGKDALLLWCKKKTKDYDNVKVDNFHTSWKDGLAFCALIHKHRPNLIDYDSLQKGDDEKNLELAFSVAESLGIDRFLDVEDMVDAVKPDERSVMAYVAQYYKYFNTGDQAEVAARRIGNLVAMEQEHQMMKTDYEKRAAALKAWIGEKTEWLDGLEVGNSVEAIKEVVATIETYKATEKPPKSTEKLDVLALLTSLQLKLRQAHRPQYEPPTGLGATAINEAWRLLEEAEKKRAQFLSEEAIRQATLASLLSRFLRKVAQQDKFNTAHGEYLGVDEPIDTLKAANSKLKAHTARMNENARTAKRMGEIEALAAKMAELQYSELADVDGRVAALKATGSDLKAKEGEKQAVLEAALAREQNKEELRKQFAEKAKALNRWYKGQNVAVRSSVFGNTLEGVRSYKAVMEDDDARLDSESAVKVAEIQALDAEMKALDITTNRYTVITLVDVASYGVVLNNTKGERAVAYAAELAKQEAMEVKRVEFAEAARAFTTLTEGVASQVAALEGEPDVVVAGIAQAYGDGEALAEQLAAAGAIDSEARGMGITSNVHTTLTMAKLKASQQALAQTVQRFLFELQEEKRSKAMYGTKVAELVDWVTNAVTTVAEVDLDNTLAKVRLEINVMKAWKVGEKASKRAVLAEITTLCATIKKNLEQSTHTRPPFAPDHGHSIDEVQTLWNTLKQAESTKDAALRAELTRQEKLMSLARGFKLDADDLSAWVAERQEYLVVEEEVDSLTAAQVQLTTLKQTEEEIANKQDSKQALVALRDEIAALNYVDLATIDETLAAVTGSFDALSELSAGKRETLQAAHAVEVVKDEARMLFAQCSGAAIHYMRLTNETVSSWSFGDSHPEIVAYKQEMEADDEKVNGAIASHSAEVAAAAAKLVELGVTGNSHAVVTEEDVVAEAATLSATVQQRQDAYAAELERSNALEEKCKEYAALASAYQTFLASHQQECEAAIDQGAEAVEAVWQGGQTANAQFESCKELDGACVGLGMVSNVHSDLPVHVLATLQKAVVANVSNMIDTLKEDAALAEREVAQQAALAAEEKLDDMKNAYTDGEQEAAIWLDLAEEACAEELAELENLAGVEEQQALHQAATDSQAEAAQGMVSLAEQATALEAEGAADFGRVSPADFQARFEATQTSLSERATALANATTKQGSDQALRDGYAAAAQELDTYISKCTRRGSTVTEETEGDMEAALAAAQAKLQQHEVAGAEKLQGMMDAYNAMLDAKIHANNETGLKAEGLSRDFTAVTDILNKGVADVEAAIAKKLHSGVSPEQLAEFKEAFDFFDKDKSGALNHLEFKGCLKSLGQEPNDDELKAICEELDANGDGTIGFDEYLNFVSNITSDHDSEDQLVAAFKVLTNGREFITEAEMGVVMEASQVAYLVSVMPKHAEEPDAYLYQQWTAATYAR